MKPKILPIIALALLTAAVLQAKENPDYTDGVFILNEDWFGHQNSTINFLHSDGEWDYRVFQQQNPGKELGCTAQYGTVFNGRMYIIAKQDKDAGATVAGGRITVCDAGTMECIRQIPIIASDENGKSMADGRAFVGITPEKGYISTSNGIYTLNLKTLEIGNMIDGTGNDSGKLYSDQCGMMLYDERKYVYAIHQSHGLLIIDTETDQIYRTIAPPVDNTDNRQYQRGYGSVIRSKDGNMWLSVCADLNGRGNTVDYIIRLDHTSLDTTRITLPAGYGAPNSWYAWTADAFCASYAENKLYWKKQSTGWFTNSVIICYDIEKNECSEFFDTQDLGWYMYCGAAFRLHPVDDEIYVTLYQDNLHQDYLLLRLSNLGEVIERYEMINNYWFPAMPIFPETEQTDVAVDNIRTPEFKISLSSNSDYMDFYLEEPMVVEIYNISGIHMLSTRCTAGKNSVSISSLPKGIYIVKTHSMITKIAKH